MIHRIRLEGVAESPAQLEEEFFALASQVGAVAFFEGISGCSLEHGEMVIERKNPADDEVRVAGRRFAFPWHGRHVFTLAPLEGDFEALQPHRMFDYRVFWEPLSPGEGPRPFAELGLDDMSTWVEQDAIVLQRQRPYHDETPGPSNGDHFLREIKAMGYSYRIEDGEGDRVLVEVLYRQQMKLGVASEVVANGVGDTVAQAACNALLMLQSETSTPGVDQT